MAYGDDIWGGRGRGVDAGTGALKGAQTGAMLGTAISPGLGTAAGAVGGGLVGGLSALRQDESDDYAARNARRLRELERRLAAGALGLTDEEKSAFFQQAEGREQAAREQAAIQRERQLASAYQGGGQAAAAAAAADEAAAEATRRTGVEVAKADIAAKDKQMDEYWARSAAVSAKQAENQARSKAERGELYTLANQFLSSELTTGGIGPSAGEAKALASAMGVEGSQITDALNAMKGDPELMNMMLSAIGGN